jgi:PAS domain-containing protein
MKRKKWPQLLLQELVGAAVWCLVPTSPSVSIGISNPSGLAGAGAGLGKGQSGWKIVFASPATSELLGYKPEELEGRDWGEIIYRECLGERKGGRDREGLFRS